VAGLIDAAGADDRAQIILVAAFALAVAFVALSVVINGAIFTQNLATRGDTAGGADAVQHRQQTERMAGALLEHANANYSGDRTRIANEFENATGKLSNVSGYQQSSSGRAVNFSYESRSDGTRIYQSSAGDFTNDTSATDWVVAEDVSGSPASEPTTGTRQFDITVTDTSVLNGLPSDPFTVTLSNGSETWELRVYASGSGDLTVKATDPQGDNVSCSASGTPIRINVTSDRLDGNHCDLDYGGRLGGDYDINFNNSDQIQGTYSLHVDQDSSLRIGNTTTDRTVYSATLRYVYRTANLEYATDVRVAPGEPDD